MVTSPRFRCRKWCTMTDPARRFFARLFGSRRVLRFASVGALNTATDITLFYILNRVTGLIVIPNILSYGLTMLMSFLLNRTWTFGDTDDGTRAGKKFLMFAALNATTLTLSTTVVYVFSLFLEPVVAKILSVFVTASVSYLGMRFVIFKGAKQTADKYGKDEVRN